MKETGKEMPVEGKSLNIKVASCGFLKSGKRRMQFSTLRSAHGYFALKLCPRITFRTSNIVNIDKEFHLLL